MIDPASSGGLSWGGGLFMLISWGTILALLVICFSKILNNKDSND
jgi:hypothetical protein